MGESSVGLIAVYGKVASHQSCAHKYNISQSAGTNNQRLTQKITTLNATYMALGKIQSQVNNALSPKGVFAHFYPTQ